MRAEAAGQLTAQQLQAGINAAQDADLPTIMRALTKKGRNLLGKLSHDEADEHGRTPLINAAAYTWDPEIVPYLISQGADVHAADAQGRTALHHVTSSNNTAAAAGIAQACCAAGADPNAKVGPGGFFVSLLCDVCRLLFFLTRRAPSPRHGAG